jgi:hypothetical protein
MDFTPICSRCAKNMDLVVIIKPLGCQPGLHAYECPFCGHTHSGLTAILGPVTGLRLTNPVSPAIRMVDGWPW